MIHDVQSFATMSPVAMSPRCRFCDSELHHICIDLGMAPLSNAMISPTQLNEMERFYPLRVYVCDQCFLVQLMEYVNPDKIFDEYTYFASYSDSWLAHAQRYAESAIQRYQLNSDSFVLELASNDGYLLRNFVAAAIPCLGVEPAANVAAAATRLGVPTVVKFFGLNTADELLTQYGPADLIIGNNVLAHVPDINDFVVGMKRLLKPGGTINMEFHHLMRLMEDNQFDTIYHEHFSYLSLLTVKTIFAAHGLALYDVEQLPTHGGSLRIYACHKEDSTKTPSASLTELLEHEKRMGFAQVETYLTFGERVKATKRKLLNFLNEIKESHKIVVGYGAPAKGNTLLNYCGIRTDYLEYTVDRSPHKQDKFLPGTHIPVYAPEKIWETRPDYVLVLPWNLQQEIAGQLASIQEWGGRLIVPIPEVRVVDVAPT
jgi:SAM-dependent methyltransferase